MSVQSGASLMLSATCHFGRVLHRVSCFESIRCAPGALQDAQLHRLMFVCCFPRCTAQGEQLAAGGLAPDGSHVILASSGGLLSHFPLDTVRQAGRAAGCVKVRP
jgi:hypothetical protein